MGETPVLFDTDDDGVAWITLNRPHVLNAMNLEVRDLLWPLMGAVLDDPSIKVAVFRGAGERAFSAGADISEFGTAPSVVEARRARRERDLWGAMLEISKPMVASIHGIAFGAGCELSLFCDVRIASDDATFALPEVKLGYIPSAGGTQTLPRTIPPGVARQMIYTGDPIDAARALEVGLVHRVVPRSRLADETQDVARALAAMPEAAVRAAKEAIRRGDSTAFAQALRAEQATVPRDNVSRGGEGEA